MQKRHNHAIYCNKSFKEKIEAISNATGLSPSDMVKAVLLFSNAKDIEEAKIDDASDYREVIILSSGRAVKRRPRLQVVLPFRLDSEIIHKSLHIASSGMELKTKDNTSNNDHIEKENLNKPDLNTSNNDAKNINTDNDLSLKHYLSQLGNLLPEPLPRNPKKKKEALLVLGFSSLKKPSYSEIKSKYFLMMRALHPDSKAPVPEKEKRYEQLSEAYNILK